MIRDGSGTKFYILVLLVDDTQNIAVLKNMTIIIRGCMRIGILKIRNHITISVKRKRKRSCSTTTEIKVNDQKS